MLAISDAEVLAQIDGLLARGLQTESARRAYSSEEVAAACRKLQALPADDVQAKLVVAGFMREAYVDAQDEDGIEQCCATCMYFERHRKYCALPELTLPVEPHWSCILWRI